MRHLLHSAFLAPSRLAVLTAARRTAWVVTSYGLAVAVAECAWVACASAGLSAVAGGWIAVAASMACAWAFVEGTVSGAQVPGPAGLTPQRGEPGLHAPAQAAAPGDGSWLGAPERA